MTEAAWTVVRRVAVAGYFVVLVVYCTTVGVPIAHDRVLLWTMAGLACASLGRSWRAIGYLLVDWVPFALVIIGYDLSRGWADDIGVGIHYTPQIRADELLFFGHVPTVWLQERLYDVIVTRRGPTAVGPVAWWEVVMSITYVTHYLASFALAGVLWVKERKRFQAFARRFVALSYLGFVTYALFPAAPPWKAAQLGYLPSFVGRFGRGLGTIHLGVIRDLIDKGAATTNLYAAVPSLHAAFTVLIAITLWPRAGRVVRAVLVAYPLLMGLTLVTTGEHYVVDLLLGAAYAIAVHLAWNRIEAWWEARRSQREGSEITNTAPAVSAVS